MRSGFTQAFLGEGFGAWRAFEPVDAFFNPLQVLLLRFNRSGEKKRCGKIVPVRVAVRKLAIAHNAVQFNDQTSQTVDHFPVRGGRVVQGLYHCAIGA